MIEIAIIKPRRLKMAYIIGGIVGFWVVYALIALFARHFASLIITLVLSGIASIVNVAVSKNYYTIISVAVAALLITFIKPIQIKNGDKNTKGK